MPLLPVPIPWRIHEVCVTNCSVQMVVVEDDREAIGTHQLVIQIPDNHRFIHSPLIEYQISQFSSHVAVMYAIEFDYLGRESHQLAGQVARQLGHLCLAKKLAWACSNTDMVAHWDSFHFLRQFAIYVPEDLIKIVEICGNFSWRGSEYQLSDLSLHQFNHLAQAIYYGAETLDVIKFYTHVNELRQEKNKATDPKQGAFAEAITLQHEMNAHFEKLLEKQPFYVNTANDFWRSAVLECLLRNFKLEVAKVQYHDQCQWKPPEIVDPDDAKFISWKNHIIGVDMTMLDELSWAIANVRNDATPSDIPGLGVKFVSWRPSDIKLRVKQFAKMYEDYFQIYFSYCFTIEKVGHMSTMGEPRQLMVGVSKRDGIYISRDDEGMADYQCRQVVDLAG